MSATFEHAIAASTPRERSGRAFRVVRIILGLLLLTAAGLKLYGMNVTALPRAGWFATPRVQIMAAEWELVLGLWLLSGVFQFCAWLAAIGTFATFAGVSAYFGWIGVANCGCFGVIHTSPWVAFAVDVAALLLLAVANPSHDPRIRRRPCLGYLLPLGAMTVLMSAMIVGSVVYGSPQAAIAHMRGELLSISPDYLDFGRVSAGETVSNTLEFQNWMDVEVTIVGGTSDCSCITTDDLPLTIPARCSKAVSIRMKVPQSRSGALTRTAELWTDNESRPTIRLRMGARIVQ